jgi:hypothetical protein
MAQVRALYEDTAVPVREIARRAGVTERTLYKYARRNNWKSRYAWIADGARPPARPGRRRWSEASERAAQVAPAKGAGGRFIRRDDIGKPFARGIKALDPAGRAAAAKASVEAACTAGWLRPRRKQRRSTGNICARWTTLPSLPASTGAFTAIVLRASPARSTMRSGGFMRPSSTRRRVTGNGCSNATRRRRSRLRGPDVARTRRGHIRVFHAVMRLDSVGVLPA